MNATTAYVQPRAQRVNVDVVVLLLLVAAALCLPMSIEASEWVPEAGRLIWVSLWAILTGVLMARSRLAPWLAWLLTLALGFEYALQFAGKLLPSLGLVLGDLGRAVGWLWNLVRSGQAGGEAPFARTVGQIAGGVTDMMRNVSAWLVATRSGASSTDNTVLWFLVACAIWLLTWFAAYELFRHHRSFLALLPLGVAVVTNVSVTYIGITFAHTFLGLLLFIMVVSNIEQMQTFWARAGLDFSVELRRDTLMAGGGLSVLVLVVALLMPYITYNQAVFAFWDRFGPGLTQFYERLDNTFAGRNPVKEATPDPRDLAEHVISAGLPPTEDVVLRVKVSDPPPLSEAELEAYLAHGDITQAYLPPKHYWRERTYDIYTGHGWDSSEQQATALPANVAWEPPTYPHTVLTQTFTLVDDRQGFILATNEPAWVAAPYRVLTRGEGDLAALTAQGKSYLAVSTVPDPTVQGLREAEGPYPDWVAERFLPLPEIPQRVIDKATEIVTAAGATTRYDKARALEVYLRQFEYDLNVEPPPLDADVVDYYIYTVQRGYCDYSATAMVVMLRSVGVAARYASGFGMGTFDHRAGEYVVTGKNAHAWAEVYFPGYGWIEFEPTPIERVFIYAGGEDYAGGVLVPPSEPARARRTIPTLWLWGGLFVLAVAFVIVWPPRWFRRRHADARAVVRGQYARLVRAARWAGIEPQGGQTPNEYLRALHAAVGQRLGVNVQALGDLDALGRLYELARFGEAALSAEDGYRAEAAWKRLTGLFFRLTLTRPSSGRRLAAPLEAAE